MPETRQPSSAEQHEVLHQEVVAALLREVNESLVEADQTLRHGQFTKARQAIAMAGGPVAALAAVLDVDLDAP